MLELLGFIAIGIVSLITLYIALRCPEISTILLVGLLIRIFVILIGHFIITLPDSTADASGFEAMAWELSQKGFFNVLGNFTGPHPKFISWLIAIPYSLFGRSILMAQSLSLFFGMGSIFLGWLLAKKIWDNYIAKKVGWTIALFPSLVLYSALILREAYIVFFIIVALYGVVSWLKTENIKSFIIAMIGFIGAIYFHGAMIVGAIIFLLILGKTSFKNFLKSFLKFRIKLNILVFFIVFITISLLYLSNKIYVPYLGNFKDSTDIVNLQAKTKNATRGTASWPEWTKINSPIELVYKAPVRSLYLVFAPFPWDVSHSRHLIGMFDAFLYMYLSFLILMNIKVIWKDPVLKTILIILLSYLFVFGIGVGNFGTGIRHRSKFVVMFILLAGPLLRKIKIFKNRQKS